jgi:leucyl-tRNA synthetase
MELTNDLSSVEDTPVVWSAAWREAIDTLVLLLAPAAPHMTEELWSHLGRPYSIHQQDWPVWREELVVEQQVTLVVQVNGKVRDRVTVPADIGEDSAKELALASLRLRPFLEGKSVDHVIYVPGRLVNIVAR